MQQYMNQLTLVLIVVSYWSNKLSKFKIVVETQFELVFERQTMIGFARLSRTYLSRSIETI